MTKPYTVVNFINDENTLHGESTSEVPSCWISEDKKKCWWPNSKNAGFRISRQTMPEKNDKNWQLHDIKIIGSYDDLAAARKKANGISSGGESFKGDCPAFTCKETSLATIKEEKAVRTKETNRKYTQSEKIKQDYSSSDESDIQESEDCIATPPKLSLDKNISKTSEDLQSKKSIKPKVISDVPASIKIPLKNTPIRIVQQNEELPSASRVKEVLNDSNGSCTSLPFFDASLNDFLIADQKSISLQIEGLATMIKDLSEEIAEKMGELAFSVRQISGRLDNLERIINSNQVTPSNNDFNDLAALFPLTTIDQVEDFENHLTMGDVRIRLVGGSSAKDCISRTLKKLFGPQLAKQSSWHGLRGNFKVGDLKIMEAVKEAVQQSFACTDKIFDDQGGEWFRQGGQKFARMQKKMEAL